MIVINNYNLGADIVLFPIMIRVSVAETVGSTPRVQGLCLKFIVFVQRLNKFQLNIHPPRCKYFVTSR